jgi:hypothetical protein
VNTLGLMTTAGQRAKRSQPKPHGVFSLFLQVAAFMEQHGGCGFKAYFSPEDGGALALFLMTDAEAYDFDLSKKLAEHVGPFVERGLLSRVMLLPASTPEELGAFIDLESALCLVLQSTGPNT